jgi:hypothetical protein
MMTRNPASQSRAKWDDTKDSFLVDAMLKAQRSGLKVDNSFKKVAWRTATADFNQHFACALETIQLKSRLTVVSGVLNHVVHENPAAY